jgi:Bacterial regulatory proteins, luxR family
LRRRWSAARNPDDRATAAIALNLVPFAGRAFFWFIDVVLAAGLSQREIATQLFISHNTVKTHMRAVYRKLDVNTRSQALRRATTGDCTELRGTLADPPQLQSLLNRLFGLGMQVVSVNTGAGARLTAPPCSREDT